MVESCRPMYFGFSPELNAAIDAGLAKYGPVE